MTANRMPAGISTGGQFAPGGRGRAQVALDTGPGTSEPILIDGIPLSGATPPAVDEVLAAILQRYYRELDRVARVRTHLAYLNYRDPWGVRRGSDGAIERTRQELETAQAVARTVQAEGEPYEAEFTRRGGWTRAFLVDNPDGHLHRSQHCSTCNNGLLATRFYWVTELSGHSEAEIVDAAGEDACTTCYPSAPVDVLNRASRIDSPNRRAAREAAEEKARRQAQKTAAEVPLTEKVDGKRSFKTERGAMNYALSQVDSLLFYRHDGRQHPMEGQWVREIRTIVDAVAAKRGADREQVRAEIIAKAEKKAKREGYQLQAFPEVAI